MHATRVTDCELRFLTALRTGNRHTDRLPPGRGWSTVSILMTRRYLEPGTAQGYHQTAASLVRKGLIERAVWQGRVWYGLGEGGREILAGLERSKA